MPDNSTITVIANTTTDGGNCRQVYDTGQILDTPLLPETNNTFTVGQGTKSITITQKKTPAAHKA